MNRRLSLWVLSFLLLATLLGFAGAMVSHGTLAMVFDNLHWSTAYLAATMLAHQGFSDAADPLIRHARKWATAGVACMFLGQFAWDIMAWLDWLPVPNPSDLFFLSIGPLITAGLWRVGAQRLSAAEWHAAKVDAAALLVATLAATVAISLPRQGDASLLQFAVLAAYPITLMMPTSLALILILKLRVRLSWRSLCLPVVTAALSLTWAMWNLAFLTHTLADGSVFNMSFSVLALCMGVGIRHLHLDTDVDAAWDRRCEGILRMLPLMLVLLAAAGVILTNTLPNVLDSTRICVQLGAAVVVAMAFMRQALLLGERDQLLAAERMLRQREAELEARVIERTQDLLKAREAAEAASQAKSDFLANMSHEIRTPLNGVLGFAQLAMMATPDPRQQEYMGKIELAGKQLLRLINDILDMSKIESGKFALEHIRFDLQAVLNSVQAQMSDQARAKGLTLQIEVDRGALEPLMGDPLRLEQILVNYVGNAIKFTERGHIDVHATVLQDEDKDVLLRVAVRDTGMGMDESTRERLFNAFEQADNSTTRRFGGTGLGLAICRKLAQLMGGEVGVDSVLHQGSCFWFTARLEKALRLIPSASNGGGLVKQADNPRVDGMRILLAEDNELNRLLACSILEQQGYTVRVAHNGMEAIELLRHEPFDCVLMDMQMPGMDGLTATRKIRDEGLQGRLPIIAMTANARPEDRQRCLDAGMDDFVSKPFNVVQMLHTLSQWCGGQAPRLNVTAGKSTGTAKATLT